MKCTEISELFSPYIDNEISPAEKKLVEEHLARCPDCAGELRQWEDMSGFLREIGSAEVDVPGELRERVMAQINGTNEAHSAKVKTKVAGLFSLPRYKGLVAAAASLLILGFGYWGFSSESNGVTKPSTEMASHGAGEIRTPVDSERDKKPEQQQTKPGDDSQKPSAAESESKNVQETNTPSVSQQEEQSDNSSEPAAPTKPPQRETVPDSQVILFNVEKKSLTASIQLAAAEKEAAVTEVKGLAEQYQADYSQQPLDQAMLIQLKVSNQNFAPIVTKLENMGEVKDKKIQEKDLTPQYKQVALEIQELEEQKKTLHAPESVKKINAQIDALKLKLAHLDQQAEHAFIAVWIE